MSFKIEEFQQKKANLALRQKILREIRGFFDAQGFDEVETPILQTCPVMDRHIHAFSTDLKGVDLNVARQMYLQTSPEFAMKKLLAAGLTKIYQICKVFRNAENSKRHSPEFTMIEWYRTGADYTDIMRDCENLLRHVSEQVDVKQFKFNGLVCDPHLKFERLSVADAFYNYAGMELAPYLEDTDHFRIAVSELGLHTAPDDDWDDLFFRVMDAKIEPYLGQGRATILYDYPVSMASLSRTKVSDPRFAERFELFICGVELANAFSELTDPKVQRVRFIEEMDAKEALYGERYPIDEDFIGALEAGLPESGGIALGIDRLVMLACGTDNIADVLWSEV